MRLFILLIVLTPLISCSTVISQIQKHNRIPSENFPQALAINQDLVDQPPDIDLSQYKSVHLRSPKKNDIAIALAASGGGYRAANLTLGVLIGLEKLYSEKLGENLLQAIDYFSTVSGSGFAIGYYLNELFTQQQLDPTKPFLLETAALQFKEENPINTDLSKYLLFGSDRGLRLEAKVNRLMFKSPKGELTLGDMFIPKTSAANVTLPYWAANATIYQNAAIFPFAPDILNRYHITGYYHNKNRLPLTNAYLLPVSVAVTASASMPIVIPPTTLISNGCSKECYLHLFDGGLGDNLGVYTAMKLLMQDESKTKILIVVDASQSTAQPYSRTLTAPGSSSVIGRLFAVDLDANRQKIRPYINFLVKRLLEDNSTKRAFVVYLDLSRYKQARRISTTLAMTKRDQQMLVDIGKKLVEESPEIKNLLLSL